MENLSKRKEWIKNFAIIFLAVLLVLTFFSNTIQNYSLPEVAAQYTSSGSITNKVRGQGVVETSDPYSVVYKSSRKVESVKVRVGDEVEKGDVLYTLEEGSSDELKEAEKTLATLKSAYEKSIIEGQVSGTITNKVESGNTASLETSQAQIDKINNSIKAYEKNVETYEAEIASYTLQITLWNDAKANQIDTTLTEVKELADAIKYEADWKTEVGLREIRKIEAEEKFRKADVSDNDYEDVKKAKDEAVESYAVGQIEYEKAQLNTENKRAAIDKIIATLEHGKTVSELNKTTAETTIANLKKDLAELTGDILTQISLEDQIAAIKEQEEVVAKLKNEEGSSEVLAPVAGTVLSLSKVAGETINQGDTVATIQVAGKGYTLSMMVTNEQATLISVGDEAEITNSWWYSDVHARIISIRPDPSNPAAGKKVVFELEGDVQNGQSLSVTVGKRTASYDNIVPTSAIREDNNGKFVYRINSKSTPLGNRYILERVDVKVLGSDDTQSAISGALEGWDYIVTTSSKPLKDGMQVRLKD